MKNILLLLLILLFGITTTSHAQLNFQPGYIINLRQDTLQGLIDRKEDIPSTISCEFKINNEAQVQTFHPGEIIGYRFQNGKYYVSKNFKMDNQPKTLFVEFLVDGKAKLYYFRNKKEEVGNIEFGSSQTNSIGEYYLFEKENQEPVILSADEKEFRLNTDNSRVINYENKKYIGTLLYLTSESNSLKRMIENSSFTHASLIKITKKFHESICHDQNCIVYEKRESKIVFCFAPYIALNSIKLNSGNYNYHYTSPSKINPAFGLMINIHDSLRSERISYNFISEVGFIKDVLKNTDSTGLATYSPTMNVDFKYFREYLGLRYTTPKGKIRLFVEGGFLVNYIFNDKAQANYKLPQFGAGLYGSCGSTIKLASKATIFVLYKYDYCLGQVNMETGTQVKINTLSLHVGIYL